MPLLFSIIVIAKCFLIAPGHRPDSIAFHVLLQLEKYTDAWPPLHPGQKDPIDTSMQSFIPYGLY